MDYPVTNHYDKGAQAKENQEAKIRSRPQAKPRQRAIFGQGLVRKGKIPRLAEGKINVSQLSSVRTGNTILTQAGVREITPRIDHATFDSARIEGANKVDSGLLLPLSEGELGAIEAIEVTHLTSTITCANRRQRGGLCRYSFIMRVYAPLITAERSLWMAVVDIQSPCVSMLR